MFCGNASSILRNSVTGLGDYLELSDLEIVRSNLVGVAGLVKVHDWNASELHDCLWCREYDSPRLLVTDALPGPETTPSDPVASWIRAVG